MQYKRFEMEKYFMNENARKYVYLYKNKELILSLCIKKGIEKEYIKSQLTYSPT